MGPPVDCPRGGGGRNKKIINPDQRGECKLSDGEQFKYLFHPGNIKSMGKPKNSQGVTLCMRYHTMIYYFRNCKYVKAYGTTNDALAVEMVKFISTARQGRKKFLSNSGREDAKPQVGSPRKWKAGGMKG